MTLALEGHTITAGVGAVSAIFVHGSSLTMRVEGVRILGPGLITNSGANTFSEGVSISVVDNSEVSGVTVLGSGGDGIGAINCNFLTITANTLGRNGTGIALFNVHSSTISGNDASGNSVGMDALEHLDVVPEPLGTVSHNIFNGNTSIGLGLTAISRGATIHHNVANGNGQLGIFLAVGGGPAEVTNNTSLANGNFDLDDFTPNCTGHVWSGNKFFTANQSCIH